MAELAVLDFEAALTRTAATAFALCVPEVSRG